MNLMKMRAHAMLGVSRIWMDDDVLCSELVAHPLGRAAVSELDVVHGRLAAALDQRRQMEQNLTELTERIASAAARFARKGRALHNAFEVLADFTDDIDQEARYRRLKVLFFPIGLRIFRRTDLKSTAAVEVVRNQVTPALMDELSSITLAGCTLADLYQEWVDAAHELGRYLHQRTRTRKALRRSGSKAESVEVKAARAEWVRVVRMLLGIADIIRLSDSGRERLMGPLKCAVANTVGSSPETGSKAEQVAEVQDIAGLDPEPIAPEQAALPAPEAHEEPPQGLLRKRRAGRSRSGSRVRSVRSVSVSTPPGLRPLRDMMEIGTKDGEIDTESRIIWPMPADREPDIN